MTKSSHEYAKGKSSEHPAEHQSRRESESEQTYYVWDDPDVHGVGTKKWQKIVSQGRPGRHLGGVRPCRGYPIDCEMGIGPGLGHSGLGHSGSRSYVRLLRTRGGQAARWRPNAAFVVEVKESVGARAGRGRMRWRGSRGTHASTPSSSRRSCTRSESCAKPRTRARV